MGIVSAVLSALLSVVVMAGLVKSQRKKAEAAFALLQQRGPLTVPVHGLRGELRRG